MHEENVNPLRSPCSSLGFIGVVYSFGDNFQEEHSLSSTTIHQENTRAFASTRWLSLGSLSMERPGRRFSVFFLAPRGPNLKHQSWEPSVIFGIQLVIKKTWDFLEPGGIPDKSPAF